MIFSRAILPSAVLFFFLAGCSMQLNPYSLKTSSLNLSLDRSIAFGEIAYDPRLDRVVVPAAGSGKLILVNPHSLAHQQISGFSAGPAKTTNTESTFGSTSAASVRGTLFAIDRAQKEILTVNPETGTISSKTALNATPDYIRFVAAKNEIWVTETEAEQIETFTLSTDASSLEKSDTIKVPNGPVYLLIDRQHGLAFTNKPENGVTAVIQVNTHGIIAEWGNGCSKAHGMAIDEDRGYLFVACNEGKVVVMDINNNGHQITSQTYGGSVDFVAYNPQLKHIYLPSAASAIIAVFAIQTNPQGEIILHRLGTADTGLDANCITTDADNNIWLCDPRRGQLFIIRDTFPPGGS
jgi:DNA-binding beta-propeller fold protein YncE